MCVARFHGLITPETSIIPYDTHMKDLSFAQRIENKKISQHKIKEYITSNNISEIVFLCSRGYYLMLQEGVPDEVEVIRPLKGMGIGHRLSWLARRLASIEKTTQVVSR